MKKLEEIYNSIQKLQNYGVPSEEIQNTLKLDKPIEDYIKKYEETKDYLGANEVAKILDKEFDEMYNYHKVLRLVRDGRLKGEKPNGNRNGVQIHKDELKRFITEESKTKEQLRDEIVLKNAIIDEREKKISALEAELDLLKIDLGILKGKLEKEKVAPIAEKVDVEQENETTSTMEEEEKVENTVDSEGQNESHEDQINDFGEIKAVVGLKKEKEITTSLYSVEFNINTGKGERFHGRVRKTDNETFELFFVESSNRNFSLNIDNEKDAELLKQMGDLLIPKMKKLK